MNDPRMKMQKKVPRFLLDTGKKNPYEKVTFKGGK
jgi:hypothetical protein